MEAFALITVSRSVMRSSAAWSVQREGGHVPHMTGSVAYRMLGSCRACPSVVSWCFGILELSADMLSPVFLYTDLIVGAFGADTAVLYRYPPQKPSPYASFN